MTKERQQNVLTIFLVVLLASIAGYYFLHRNPSDKTYVEVKPFKGSNGWGYDIVNNDKIYIHQEFIPVIRGKKGFNTEQDARRTGSLVLEKIRNNEVPALTLKDLKDLGIVTDTTQQ